MIAATNILRLLAIFISAYGAYYGCRYDFHENGKLTKHGKVSVFLIFFGLIVSMVLEMHNIAHENDTRNEIIHSLDSSATVLNQQIIRSKDQINSLTNGLKKNTDSLSQTLNAQQRRILQLKKNTDYLSLTLDSQQHRMLHLNDMIAGEATVLDATSSTAVQVKKNLDFVNNRIFSTIKEYQFQIELYYGNVAEHFPSLAAFIKKNENRTDNEGTPVFESRDAGRRIMDSLTNAHGFNFKYKIYFSISDPTVTGGDELYAVGATYLDSADNGNPEDVAFPQIEITPFGGNAVGLMLTFKKPFLTVARTSHNDLLSEEDWEINNERYRLSLIVDSVEGGRVLAPELESFRMITLSNSGKRERLLDLKNMKASLDSSTGRRIYTGFLTNLIRRSEGNDHIKIQ